jgi:hypothetical protein
MSSKLKVTLFVVMLASATFLHAGITTYSSQSLFDAQGTIAYNTSFSCSSGNFCFPGNPYTIGGVTYNATQNVIAGAGGAYSNSVAVLLNNYWSPLPGTIETSPTHDMFGFLLGSLGGTSLMDITIDTNLTSYTYSGLSVPNVSSGLQFFGYISTGGEYLTGFNLVSEIGAGDAPAITNVEVGNSNSAVPEPGTFLMLGSGIVGLAGVLRRKLLT